MAFNSLHFVVFLATVFGLYWLVAPHRRLRNALLLAASYWFYMHWDWRYAALLVFSTVLDYTVALAIEATDRPGRRKLLLACSLAGNLGVLATFKYFNFFLDSFASTLGAIGFSGELGHLQVLLPVGISFYTFQTLSYTIDVYRGSLPARRSLLDVAVFVAFFPQLVAGPIVRASDFLPQLDLRPRYDDRRTLDGVRLIFRGLAKKVLIADTLAVAIVDPVYAEPGAWSGAANLLATYAYALQIYCDFSGYSDAAIGSAKLLGLELPINFNRPYLAVNIRDFWARWHISLSTWLRDYLYVPLGGNRKGQWLTYRNLAITMLLGGLWHGAAWNFVLWGAFHGGWLMTNRWLFGGGAKPAEAPLAERIARRALTFHLVCVGWVLFRAANAFEAATVLGRIVTWAPGRFEAGPLVWAPLAIGFALHWLNPAWLARLERRFVDSPGAVQGAAYATMILLLVAAGGVETPFIYFQF
jgi:D-alanyl-lipoteichoic acid acyltransferase DltB (MBOAT superfamily)